MIIRLSDQQAQYLYDTLSQRNIKGFDKTTSIIHESVVEKLGSELEGEIYAQSIVEPPKWWLENQTRHYEEPLE